MLLLCFTLIIKLCNKDLCSNLLQDCPSLCSVVHADPVMTDTVVGASLHGRRGSLTTDLHTAEAVGAVTSLCTLPQVFLAQILTGLEYVQVSSHQGNGVLPSVAVR